MESKTVSKIQAFSNEKGNRIDLEWKNPSIEDFPEFGGVKIVRHNSRFPGITSPKRILLVGRKREFKYDGKLVYDGREEKFSDTGLLGERVYYYIFYTYTNDPVHGKIKHFASSKTQVSQIATSNYSMGKMLYELLPAIYKRYDTNYPVPGSVSEEDGKKGQLERFLEIFGLQLDYIRSVIGNSRNNIDIEKCEGSMLEHRAHWIGWKTDPSHDYDINRSEIKNAPEIYKTVGNKGNLAAYARYLTGSECRIKEYVHNVFLTNNPDRYYIRQCKPTQWEQEYEPITSDFAFEGKVSVVKDQDKKLWMFYHANQGNQCNIWYKSCKKNDNDNYDWEPGFSLTNSVTIDCHPVALEYDNMLWVFWDSFNETLNTWQIRYKIYDGTTWGEECIFLAETGEESTERKSPSALVAKNGLWIFWLEKTNINWRFKYTMHDRTKWVASKNFNLPGITSKDFFVVCSNNPQRIWAFWTEKKTFASDTTTKELWVIKYAWKRTSNILLDDWNNVIEFPKFSDNVNYDDIEPVCISEGRRNIKMYWSSNKDGSWSLFESVLNALQNRKQPIKISKGPYNQRNPFIIPDKNNYYLGYRSNECIIRHSEIFNHNDKDFSPAGSPTIVADNILKHSLRNSYEDFTGYTYDTGTSNNDMYARDTIGIFLTPVIDNRGLINSNVEIISNLLREFLPIQIRPLFFIETPLYKEIVYTHDLPGEKFFDSISDSILEQKYNPIGYSREDTVPDWIWIRTADCINEQYFDNQTVSFDIIPVSTKYRSWHTGLTNEKMLWI